MITKQIKQLYQPFSATYSVIVANGQLPNSTDLKQIIAKAQVVIACDGAANNLTAKQLKFDYVIGDCDSITAGLKSVSLDKLITISDQNSNDLTKAVNFARHKLKLDNIIVIGATGLREDHSIANISLLMQYQQQLAHVALISNYGIFTAHNKGQSTLATIARQQVSFFTTNAKTAITCAELKWPLDNFQCASWHAGTLNEAISKKINFDATGDVIVYRCFLIF